MFPARGDARRSVRSCLKYRLGDDAHRSNIGAGQHEGADPVLFRDVLPGLEAVADAVGGADQRDLVDEGVGHRGGGRLALAVEEQVLDLDGRPLIPDAAGEIEAV